MYIDKTLYTTAPSAEGRLEKEMRVYELLEQLQIPYTRIDHEHADTIEDCAAIETLLGAQICKNLFLRNRQATNFYLLLMPGDKRFLQKSFPSSLVFPACLLQSRNIWSNILTQRLVLQAFSVL